MLFLIVYTNKQTHALLKERSLGKDTVKKLQYIKKLKENQTQTKLIGSEGKRRQKQWTETKIFV